MMERYWSETSLALLSLMKLKGVGRRAALKIVDRSLDGEMDWERTVRRAASSKLQMDSLTSSRAAAYEQLTASANAGIKAVSFHDQDYPSRLRRTPDPPAILYIKGDPIATRSATALAVIGTREPTDYGERVAHRLAASAAREGFVIVSGLAHGCDTFAHEGCVEAHGKGVAVLAHGLDRVYPAANKDLAKRLLEAGGCLVSEYPLGMTPVRTAFAERDRIQSGLSDGVLVIETDIKGGTMHTVRFSQEQNRPLACIDHPENWRHEPKTRGNQMLITSARAEPIPDNEALMKFLSKLRQRGSVPSAGVRPGDTQTTMDV